MEEQMQHFSAIQWADFVRGISEGPHHGPMQEHLQGGCKDCGAEFAVWTRLADFMRRENDYEPPPGAVRVAQSYLFPFSMALKRRTGIPILRHVFDSLEGGIANNLRSSASAPRQVMYRTSNIVVDLRIEEEPGSKQIALTGQVMDSEAENQVSAQTQVSLLRNRKSRMRTTTSDCGEFAFTFKSTGKRNVGLLVDVKDNPLLFVVPQPESAQMRFGRRRENRSESL
jgi:hypothetical protein